MEALIKCTKTGSIAIVVLNLPLIVPESEARFLEELHTALSSLSEDPQIHSVILAGSGRQSDSFALEALPSLQRGINASLCRKCLTLLGSTNTVTIAAINGSVFHTIYKIVMACDMRIGTEKTLFRIPKTGTEEVISAQKALYLGLLDEIVDSKELIAYCMEQAQGAADILGTGAPTDDFVSMPAYQTY